MIFMDSLSFSTEPIFSTLSSIKYFYDNCSEWSILINLHFNSAPHLCTWSNKNTKKCCGQEMGSGRRKEETEVTYALENQARVSRNQLNTKLQSYLQWRVAWNTLFSAHRAIPGMLNSCRMARQWVWKLMSLRGWTWNLRSNQKRADLCLSRWENNKGRAPASKRLV